MRPQTSITYAHTVFHTTTAGLAVVALLWYTVRIYLALVVITNMHVHVHARSNTHTCTYIHTHTYALTLSLSHTHTHMHAHTYTHQRSVYAGRETTFKISGWKTALLFGVALFDIIL